MSKRQIILHLATILHHHNPETGWQQSVVFDVNEDYDVPSVLLTPEDWADMGLPREITVTIEAGDKLNG